MTLDLEAANRNELAKLFFRLGFSTGAEIGVRGGRYSEILCQCIPGVKLYCIDTWGKFEDTRRGGLRQRHTKALQEATDRLSPYHATLIQKLSTDACLDFTDASLDFVYLDAGHSFDAVMRDILDWSPKVKPGGIVSGHDYVKVGRCGVVDAVDAYTKYHKLTLHLTNKSFDRGTISWFWQKH